MPTSDERERAERERAERVIAELSEQLREIVMELALNTSRLRSVGAELAMHEERAMTLIKDSREHEARREVLLMNKLFVDPHGLNDLSADAEVLQDLARQCREGIRMAEAVLRAPD